MQFTNYTRNSDLKYYESNPESTNCGSYALRLNEWYDPEKYFEDTTGWFIEDWITDLAKDYLDEEISNKFNDILVEGMLIEFQEELELCDGSIPTDENVELIAFNSFCCYDEDNNFSDYDFHFKVYRNNRWMEKRGAEEVRECDIKEWGRYIGEPIYMYHKINNKKRTTI